MASSYHPVFNSKRTTWVFDLDNTLYEAECDLFAQVDRKIGQYVQNLLSLAPNEAQRLQKKYLIDHGTTLNGLIQNHKVDPHHYLADVHDIDFSPIKPNPELRQAIESLEGQKLVFTNADKPYASKVLEHLGIDDLIDGVFGIVEGGLTPKPAPDVYETFIRTYDFNPQEAVMFEDMVRNLKPAYERGMATVWINTQTTWGKIDHDPAYIHEETNNLTSWLKGFTNT